MPADALFDLAGGKVGFLATLSLAAYGDHNPPDGLAPLAIDGLGGLYFTDTDGVAVALVGRSADALFLAFRGTDDQTDRSEWLRLEQHFDRFAPLIADLESYLATTTGIARVYVTGHSLGGAMAQALMERWVGDGIEAVTFASPGLGLGRPDADDARIANIRLSGDPVSLVAQLSGVRGDQYLVTDIGAGGADLDAGERHAAASYLAIARHLDAAGLVPTAVLASNGRVDDRIEVPVRIERAAEALDLTVRAVDDLSLGDLFGAAGFGIAVTPSGIVFVGRVAGRSTGSSIDDMFAGGDGGDTLLGGDGNDEIAGAGGADAVRGDAGSDLIQGGNGDDWHLNGNADADTVAGGDGADRVHGGRGDDAIQGGAGDDTVSGDRGDDTIAGGGGADRFLFGRGAGRDLVLDLDPAAGDRIVLQPDLGIPDAAAALARIAADADGHAVLDFGGGDLAVFRGVAPGAIVPELFLFA